MLASCDQKRLKQKRQNRFQHTSRVNQDPAKMLNQDPITQFIAPINPHTPELYYQLIFKLELEKAMKDKVGFYLDGW